MNDYFETVCVFADEERNVEYTIRRTFKLSAVMSYEEASPGVFKNHTPGTFIITNYGSNFHIMMPYRKFSRIMQQRQLAATFGINANTIHQ
jgi:hypothetical protein